MSKFKFINVIDTIFISFSIFLLCFAWLEFYIRDIWLAVVISVFVAFCILFLLKYFKDKKLAKKFAIIEKNNKTESYMLNFQLYSQQKQLSIIKSFIKNKDVKTIGQHLEFLSNNKKTIVTLSLKNETFNKTILLDLIKTYKNKCDKLIIFASSIASDCLSFSKSILNFKVVLLDKQDFYNFCVENNIEIEEKIKLKVEKISIKNIAKNFFSASHFKGFFITGCLLIITSVIFPFTNYYLIFGTILIIISLICKLPKFKAKKINIFD